MRNQDGVVIHGKVLDDNYASVLFDNPDFDLQTVFLIDRVQKHHPINSEAVKYLRKFGVVEGKMPNIYIAAKVAKIIDEKHQYVRNKGFDDETYCKWIVSYLETYKTGKNKILSNC